MHPASTPHPNDSTLRAYALGQLTGASAEAVDAHLKDCPACQGLVAGMTDGRSLDLLDSGPAPANIRTVQADVRHRSLLRGSEWTERFEVGDGGVIGRDGPDVAFQLHHPHVSRRHASLTTVGSRVMITDLESSNGTYVNGRRILKPTILLSDDRIDIGPFSLQFDGSGLDSRSRSNNIELAAHGVSRVVQNRATGKPLAILEDVSLVVRPREFVCLLGPSGSGKSTLLAILSGRNPPTAGGVTVNGEDLFADFEALKGDIAVVPQKDVLHDALSVGTALRYTAELRLPTDLARAEVEASVTDILEVVSLTERRSTLIRHLSGGQVKRASLANELVAGASLLFLDEVTSGLDEQTDREVMELFRQVADSGKTVVCITHSLANVETTCHLVVILTVGGRLAFVGTPDEARTYFAIKRLGDVYGKLKERPAQEWHDLFRASPHFKRLVADRMTSGASAELGARSPSIPAPRSKVNGLRQAWVLTRRYVQIWRGDIHALLVLLCQSLLVALLLGLVFGNLNDVSNPFERAQRTRNLLFLLTVSCVWFGCNTAAKEVVKERVIFQRERDYNLRVGSYFVSKLLILTLIGVAQATLLFGVVRPWCHPPGAWASQWFTLAALATAGTSLGLFLSTIAPTEEVATALVPIAVIPQIILAGVVAPLKGIGLALAKGLISVYWGQQAIERLLPDAEQSLLQRPKEDWLAALLIVVLHGLTANVGSVVVLWFTSAKSRR